MGTRASEVCIRTTVGISTVEVGYYHSAFPLSLTLVPATGGIFTPQCSNSRKSPTKQWIKTVSFHDIVTDPFGFLTPLSVSLYLLPVLRGRSASNVHETGFPQSSNERL